MSLKVKEKDALLKELSYGASDESMYCHYIVLTSSSKASNDKLVEHFMDLINVFKRKGHKFEYLAIFTNQGNGVVHVLVRNCWVLKDEFVHYWSIIHSSPIVYKTKVGRIKSVRNSFVNKICEGIVFAYCVSDCWS